MPFPHEIDQRVVHILGMRSGEEMLAALHGDEVCRRGIGEELDFFFGIGDAVDGVVGALCVKKGWVSHVIWQ